MPHVTLQRRHAAVCSAHRLLDSYTTEVEERRRGFVKCNCKIYAHGTLAGIFKKFATRARDWSLARDILAPYLAAGRWDIVPPPLPPSPLPTPPGIKEKATAGRPMADAQQAFFTDLKENDSAEATTDKYKQVLRKMDRFALDKGLRFIEEWTPTLLREMRSSWQLSAATRTSQFSLVKSFFELFVEDKTIPFNPARIRSRRPNRAARNSARRQVNPYTNQQLETMLDLCRQMKPDSCVVRIDQCTTGQDLADFIELSVYTGLRISDMVTFDISRLTDDNQVWLRAATKNGEPVLTWIPDWLAQRVRLRAQRIGPRIFGTRQTEKLCVLTEAWRRKLRPIFQAAGFPSKGPDKATPHRFRHTFVRILLEAHVPVGTVAILAGDTEAMIRKHYSGWIQSRQEQTRQTLEQAFRHVPRSHY